ncbi:MAG: glycosyltransferase [bacterium]|nr:glycosyltransferase [bacterium]
MLACNLNAKATEQLLSAVQRDGLDPNLLVIAPQIDDADLTKLYLDAVALLNPSLLEGLSLSLVNAIELGTPIIAAKQLAQEETCGDAAIYVDALNVTDLVNAARQLLLEPSARMKLINASRGEATRFNWKRLAESSRSM